jgi:hypothetical protein
MTAVNSARITCPVDGCIKRGTKSALAQHARAIHPHIDRALYERATLRNLRIDSKGHLMMRPRRRTLWPRPRHGTRSRPLDWATLVFYTICFLVIGFLYLAKQHDFF